MITCDPSPVLMLRRFDGASFGEDALFLLLATSFLADLSFTHISVQNTGSYSEALTSDDFSTFRTLTNSSSGDIACTELFSLTTPTAPTAPTKAPIDSLAALVAVEAMLAMVSLIARRGCGGKE